MSDDDLTLAEMIQGMTAQERAAPVNIGMLAHFMAAVDERLATMERRMGAVEEKGAETYRRGQLVTFGGSLFHCNAESTRAEPGSSRAWTLCAKGQPK